MKKLLLSISLLFALSMLPVGATGHLTGKIIALDAGHGGGATGAIGYCGTTPVVEADVNLTVAETLKAKIEASEPTVTVVILDRVSSRKARVTQAENIGADVLISIHHNGSSDPTVDYTKTFITQNRDKKLANPIHKALVAELDLPDKGIRHDGFGMTVYASMPSILSEAYFITSTDGACEYLNGTRVTKEVNGFYNGLSAYFSDSGSGGGNGNKGGGKGRNK